MEKGRGPARGEQGDVGEASGKGDELEASLMTHMCENLIMKLIKLKKKNPKLSFLNE